MIVAGEILGELFRRGVAVLVDGGMLRLKPKSALDDGLLSRVREHKAEIIGLLARPEICRHCDGAGECSCPACTLRRTEKPVPCLMCHPEKRQIWLAATRPETCWHCEGKGECGCIACRGVCSVCASGERKRAN